MDSLRVSVLSINCLVLTTNFLITARHYLSYQPPFGSTESALMGKFVVMMDKFEAEFKLTPSTWICDIAGDFYILKARGAGVKGFTDETFRWWPLARGHGDRASLRAYGRIGT